MFPRARLNATYPGTEDWPFLYSCIQIYSEHDEPITNHQSAVKSLRLLAATPPLLLLLQSNAMNPPRGDHSLVSALVYAVPHSRSARIFPRLGRSVDGRAAVRVTRGRECACEKRGSTDGGRSTSTLVRSFNEDVKNARARLPVSSSLCVACASASA